MISSLPDTRFEIALSVALYTEWQAVLGRPEHRPPGHLRVEDVLGYLRYLASIAHLQEVYYLWRPFLRDPGDDMVLECAVASGSQYLVTHNIRDFQRIGELGVTMSAAYLKCSKTGGLKMRFSSFEFCINLFFIPLEATVTP